MSEKKRESNFELLRIVAMLMIIFHHICQHTPNSVLVTGTFDPNKLDSWLSFIHLGFRWIGTSANYCFMLISGWFLSKSAFTWKKWLLLYAEYWFYSVAVGAVMFLLGESSKPELLKCLAPMCFSGNWYLRAYLIFFLFLPFLNKLLPALTRREHFWLCVLLLFVGHVFTKTPFFTGNITFGFFTSFFFASYIRTYKPTVFDNQARNTFILVLLVCVSLARSLFVKTVGEMIPAVFQKRSSFYTSCIGFIGFPTALFLFAIFKNLKMPSIKVINVLASTTLGVYLIHEHQNTRVFFGTSFSSSMRLRRTTSSSFVPLR